MKFGLGYPKTRKLSASGGFTPDPDQPWTPVGALPQDCQAFP